MFKLWFQCTDAALALQRIWLGSWLLPARSSVTSVYPVCRSCSLPCPEAAAHRRWTCPACGQAHVFAISPSDSHTHHCYQQHH